MIQYIIAYCSLCFIAFLMVAKGIHDVDREMSDMYVNGEGELCEEIVNVV